MMARFLAGVADGVTGFDGALARNCAGAGEDGFEEGCLAALERAHQCNASWTRGSCAVLCHVSTPLSTAAFSKPSGPVTIVSTVGRIGKRPAALPIGCDRHAS